MTMEKGWIALEEENHMTHSQWFSWVGFENYCYFKDFSRLADIEQTQWFFRMLMGAPAYNAYVIREFIEIDYLFKAEKYGNLPIGPEVRFFINNNRIVCHHFYWQENSFNASGKWDMELSALKDIVEQDYKIIADIVVKVAEKMDGFYSVDFAKAKNGNWYLLDMAEGHLSWHPDCITKESR